MSKILVGILAFSCAAWAGMSFTPQAGASFYISETSEAEAEIQPWQYAAGLQILWAIPTMGLSEDKPLAVGLWSGYHRLYTAHTAMGGDLALNATAFSIPILFVLELPFEEFHLGMGLGVHAWNVDYSYENDPFAGVQGGALPTGDNSIDFAARFSAGFELHSVVGELGFNFARFDGESEDQAGNTLTLLLGYRFHL